MEQELVREVISGPDSLSLWNLFLQADIVVKLVMLILILASIWCWTIILEKFFLARSEIKMADSFENEFWSGGSLDNIYDQMIEDQSPNKKGSISRVFASAMEEWRRATAIANATFGSIATGSLWSSWLGAPVLSLLAPPPPLPAVLASLG